MLPEAGRNLEESQETLEKLNSISRTISEMASNYQESESYEKNLEIFEDELADSLEGLENNFLYEEIWDNKGNIIEDILPEEYLKIELLYKETGREMILTPFGQKYEEIVEELTK